MRPWLQWPGHRRDAATDPALAGTKLGTEVNLDPGKDEGVEVAEHADPRLLQIGRVHGVVHVAHRVTIAEAHVLTLHEGERIGHGAMV